MTNRTIPTPALDTLRAAFIEDGLSVTDTGANEWIDMQDTVIAVINESFAPADDDERDAMYSHADTIVGRLDRAGKV